MIRFELKIYKVAMWRCPGLWRDTGGDAVKKLCSTGKGVWTMVMGHMKTRGEST